ncbi:MAG: hypothetical protein LCH93_13740 [Proteobacteria bacterium]|nr:hypothetical protein [Pseudomonadota bacterium]
MKETVQQPVRKRDEAVQAEEVKFPWSPRNDGKRALLVSERATVFDVKAAALQSADPLGDVRDPIWDHKNGAKWTPELVHCRLLLAGEIYLRLPDRLRTGQLRSFLGNVAIAPSEVSRRSAPSPMEITLADWTFERLYELPAESRELMQARAFGVSFDKIVEQMRRAGMDARKRTVVDWARDVRRVLAGDWSLRKHPVDAVSFERWRRVFVGRPK